MEGVKILFSYIKGPLVEVFDDVIVIEAGQIGWNIHVPLSVMEALPRIGEELCVYTSFQVREDAMTLYGFLSRQELSMFRMLLSVNGIGAKAALSILSSLRLHDLRLAVLSEDVKAIAKAPGVGPKTAKRVILDLKDKLKAEDILPGGMPDMALAAEKLPESLGNQAAAKEAVEALVALGYSMTEATRAVRQVEVTDGMDAEAVLKASLKHLL